MNLGIFKWFFSGRGLKTIGVIAAVVSAYAAFNGMLNAKYNEGFKAGQIEIETKLITRQSQLIATKEKAFKEQIKLINKQRQQEVLMFESERKAWQEQQIERMQRQADRERHYAKIEEELETQQLTDDCNVISDDAIRLLNDIQQPIGVNRVIRKRTEFRTSKTGKDATDN